MNMTKSAMWRCKTYRARFDVFAKGMINKRPILMNCYFYCTARNFKFLFPGVSLCVNESVKEQNYVRSCCSGSEYIYNFLRDSVSRTFSHVGSEEGSKACSKLISRLDCNCTLIISLK